MHHVVQLGLFHEFGFNKLMTALEEENLPHTLVKVVPFGHTVEPDVNVDGPVMVWGANTLGYIAKEKGWHPGVFTNDDFNMRTFHERLKGYCLNDDAEYCTFGELEFKGLRFCRPVHDTKTFTGEVLDGAEIEAWKERVIPLSNNGYTSLMPDTPVLHAKPKAIDVEARFFVVDGQVITGSSYRTFGRQKMYQLVETGNPTMRDLLDFAQFIVNLWQPDVAFVLDVGWSEGEKKAIEINTLNSAGFYACNMRAVVRALESINWSS